ncbi:MAG TPA: VWA domain-containing protein [Vicinamibacterales bacterium]|jgi:VWFA-related protein
MQLPLGRACLLAFLAGSAASARQAAPPPQSPQGQPTFRTAVDVVAVDVSVIDRDGRPVGDLEVKDFSLKVDGKPRQVRSAEFISLRRLDDPDPAPASFSTNAGQAPGRLIMIVIDQANIRKGAGRNAFLAASRFIDRLNRSDRVALEIIPGSGPVTDFTANHGHVKAMIERAVGQAVEADHTGRVGVSEAMAVMERGEGDAWNSILERECPAEHDITSLAQCRQILETDVRAVYMQAKNNTAASLVSLRGIVDRLAWTSEPKSVVIISEGLVVDRNLTNMSWVGPKTAAARVSLYGIRLSAPLYDVELGRTSPTREADQALLAEGMEQLIGLGRGSVYSVAVNAGAVFNRLALELSGYYLITFEPETADRDGRRHDIAVNVTRPGLTIRARRQFSAEPLGSNKPVDDLLTDTMRSALPASDFDLRLTTFSYQDDASGRVKVIIGAEIDRSFNPAGPLAVAYHVRSENGAAPAADVEKSLTPAPGQEGRPQHYMTAVLLEPGPYTIKMAVVDDQGHRASVSRTFDAKLTFVGQIRMGELMLVRPGGGAGLRPVIDTRVDTGSIAAYTELYSQAEPQLARASLTLEIAASEDGRTIDSVPMAITGTAGKRIAQAALPVHTLAPGAYVARAVLSSEGRAIGRVTRPLTILAPPVPTASTPAARVPAPAAPIGATPAAPAAATPASSGPATPIAFESTIEAFDRRAVLTRPVIGFFIDRMTIVGLAPVPESLLPAIGYARMGQFGDVLRVVDAARSDHVVGSFLSGVAELARGDVNRAALDFAQALKIVPGFFPAAFYLGACYAAGGQDKEAAAVWRTTLVTDPSAPWIYTSLSDALLRSRETAQALNLLREVVKLWPDNDDVLMRWGTALSMAGQPDQAIKTLDGYLSRHPADGDRLLLSMRLLYEARILGRPLDTADADRSQFLRYFSAYEKLGAPGLNQAREWRKHFER